VATLVAAALIAVLAPFPHAQTTPACGARTIPFQQQALAVTAHGAWIACRDARMLERVDPGTGRIGRRIALPSVRPWAIAAGGGSLWVIDRDRPELLQVRESSGRVRRIALPGTPAALWVGAGSAWIGFDMIGFARVDLQTLHVTPTFSGDGVSAFAGDGRTVYVVSHRDNGVQRVTGGRVEQLATRLREPATTATEQAAFADGALWITGRGLDLLRFDPKRRRITAQVEIGPAGLAVAHSGRTLLVASYSARGAQRGDPIVGRLSVVDPSTGRVTRSVTASATMYLSGLALDGGALVAADTALGRFLRLRLT
jgi:streptogramin lyase